LARKPEGKTTLRKPSYGWENKIKMGLKEIGDPGVDWIHLAQNRLPLRAPVNTVK
jgi:hypothetical protein